MGRDAHLPLLAAPERRDREAAEAAFNRLGSAHLAMRPVTEISCGELQLVLIARASYRKRRFWCCSRSAARPSRTALSTAETPQVVVDQPWRCAR